MLFDNFGEKLNRLLYRNEVRRLTAAELQMAEDYSLSFIRRYHPKWPDDEVRRYYDSLLHDVKIEHVDEWSRRFGKIT